MRVTVQLSVPAPDIEAELQESDLGTGTPDPLILTTRLPVDELLAIVRAPVNPAPLLGANEIVTVAVWPELSVNGVVMPDAAN